MGEIYIIKNDFNDKVYVGKTSRTSDIRWNEHIKNNIGNNQVIHQVMRFEGIKHFYYEILEKDIDDNELNDREEYWIRYYNSLEPNGYNQTYGGNDVKSWQNLNIDKARENVKKAQEASKRSVIMCDSKTSEEIQTFQSIAEANVFLGKRRYATGINDCLSGRSKTAYGYKWKYNE